MLTFLFSLLMNAVHFLLGIGTPQSFPPPLSAAEEREALQRSIDDDAQRAEAERSLRADSLAASFEQSGNRLTAMGLGAGADNARTVDQINGKISTVLDLLRQELDAIRNIRQGGTVATFGA